MSKIAVNEITDEVGTGAPAFPNGMSATGAALTDPEITGGIFLGGTGSANKLDDYEEGTWTPGFESTFGSFGTLTFDIQVGYYTKFGNVVTIYGRTNCTTTNIGTASGELFINNLPFVSANVSGGLVISGSTSRGGGPGPNVVSAFMLTNNTRFRPLKTDGNTIQIPDLAAGSRNDFSWTVTYTV
jgi:hypothetical protein